MGAKHALKIVFAPLEAPVCAEHDPATFIFFSLLVLSNGLFK
jgi:hypothetical protein